jgi:signal transduction histidine kinase
MDLAAIFRSKPNQIIEYWTELVVGPLHPEAMPHPQLVDHLPRFLSEIAQALSDREIPGASPTAALHGDQRLALGFSLDGVVREYGALHKAALAVASREGVDVSNREREVLDECIVIGIAEAVSQYQRQRDAELQRHMNEHFAFIAHELRNPLGSSLAAVHLLERKRLLDGDERLARVLSRNLTRMLELIDNTLRVAQLSTGIALHIEPVMLGTLLEEVELAAGASADERSITLTCRTEGDQLIAIDRRLVQSALGNLVQNAVKFSHEHGNVEVRARCDGARALIEVEDSCGGLPDGAVLQAFAPFTQLGADRSGFGLGLAIAKQAADAHGGVIRIQNLPTKGCIFSLELPVQQPSEQPSP